MPGAHASAVIELQPSAGEHQAVDMRTHAALILAPFAVAACGDELVVGYYAEQHVALRTPCSATLLPAHHTHGLVCSNLPEAPAAGDPDIWRGARARGATWTQGAEVEPVTFDEAPMQYTGATYRLDGNLDTVRLGEDAVLQYTYQDGTLTGGFVMQGAVRRAEVEVVYEGGRRAYEGLVDDSAARVTYHYDEAGYLIAKLGVGVAEALPEAPAPSMLDEVCHGLVMPLVPPTEPGADMTALYYFRDSTGRILTIIEGQKPGQSFARIDFTYDGDRLMKVERTCSKLLDPAHGNLSVEFGY